MKISQNRLSIAQNAAENPIWIDTPSGLARAAKAWSRQNWLAIDTEFVRERTYFAKLGLIQISDAQTVWLVDVPALDNLQPLSELMANAGINKILHSAGEDLEILHQRLTKVPTPLFDSQVAAAMLGYPLQLAYEQLMNELLPIQLEKGPSRSNWLKRPLTDEQILYASNDVAYLPLATEILHDRLHSCDRLIWHSQDMHHQNTQAQRTVNAEALYLRVKGAGRLNGMGLAWLQRLAIWRNQQAQSRDLPRSFVLSDPELVAVAALAVRCPSVSEADIETLQELHPKARRRYADVLAELLQEKPAQPLPEFPGRPDPVQRKQLADMQTAAKQVAVQHNIEPALLASKRVLQSLQRRYLETGTRPSLDGWRGELLNAKLRSVLNIE